jgi:hypothetical protein
VSEVLVTFLKQLDEKMETTKECSSAFTLEPAALSTTGRFSLTPQNRLHPLPALEARRG